MEEKTDKELYKEFLQGNKESFEKIVIRHKDAIIYFIQRYVKSVDIAEDLTQETFYQATKTIKNFRGECKVSVWLCQIAKRLWYKEIDKRKQRNIPLEEMEEVRLGNLVVAIDTSGSCEEFVGSFLAQLISIFKEIGTNFHFEKIYFLVILHC